MFISVLNCAVFPHTPVHRDTIRAAADRKHLLCKPHLWKILFFCLPSSVCVIQDEACQIKGSSGCNMSIQAVLDQYPSLQGCVCVWEEEEEEELCGSIQALATQCSPKTGAVFSVLFVTFSIQMRLLCCCCLPRVI